MSWQKKTWKTLYLTAISQIETNIHYIAEAWSIKSINNIWILTFLYYNKKTHTNKVQNIVAPLLEKTRGKAALPPHRLKVSKPIACVQGKRLRSKCLAGKTPSTRTFHGPNGSVLVVFLQIFFNREDIRVQCFLWGSPQKKQLNWTIWGLEIEV